MANLVEENLEFAEVLNAFPYIKQKLEKSEFDLRDVKDDVSIHDYFKNKNYTQEEIDIFVKKVNFDLKNYLKGQEEKEFKLQEEKDVLIPMVEANCLSNNNQKTGKKYLEEGEEEE